MGWCKADIKLSILRHLIRRRYKNSESYLCGNLRQKVLKEFEMNKLIKWLIGRYSQAANTQIEAGKRPPLLPCESDGIPCSLKFATMVTKFGTSVAVGDLSGRCPKGQHHALKAIAYSAALAIVPIVALSASDDCTSCDSAFGC